MNLSRMYSGPLAEMLELEKLGVDEIMKQLKARYELRDFGVKELVGLDVCTVAHRLHKPLWSTAVYATRDMILEAAAKVDLSKLPFRFESFHVSWEVPNRDDPNDKVRVYGYIGCGCPSCREKLSMQLLQHEIDEQLLFSGVRVFDPHA